MLILIKSFQDSPGLLKVLGALIISFTIITSSLKKVFESERWMKFRLIRALFSNTSAKQGY